MTRLIKQTILAATLLFSFLFARVIRGGDWTSPVEVRHDVQKCVSYRAKLSGDFLVVQATHEPGWHTYAMDNKLRAQEKLAGKKSLGVDRPTEIVLAEGLELAGPWYQSVPKDLSKPELRWFTWGFEGQALFVTRVRRAGAGPANVTIRGQACAKSTCKNIDLAISVPLGGSTGRSDIDLKSLVQVR
jgi:DsbC/DsbD-like thiol-disulfide interchange protein